SHAQNRGPQPLPDLPRTRQRDAARTLFAVHAVSQTGSRRFRWDVASPGPWGDVPELSGRVRDSADDGRGCRNLRRTALATATSSFRSIGSALPLRPSLTRFHYIGKFP